MHNQNTNNPNNNAYWKTRGYGSRPSNWKKLIPAKSKRQLNREKYHFVDGLGPLSKDDY